MVRDSLDIYTDQSGAGTATHTLVGVPLWRMVAGTVSRFYDWSPLASAVDASRPGVTAGIWYPTDGDDPAREVAGELRDRLQLARDALSVLPKDAFGIRGAGDDSWSVLVELIGHLDEVLERARETKP